MKSIKKQEGIYTFDIYSDKNGLGMSEKKIIDKGESKIRKSFGEDVKKLLGKLRIAHPSKFKMIVKNIKYVETRPRIMCVGIYNSGKSSLLNCILGDQSEYQSELFPTDDVTFTKAIWESRKGMANQYHLYTIEGKRKTRFLSKTDFEEQLEDLAVAIREDKEFLQKYQPKVVVEYKDSEVLGKFTIVDSPGWGEDKKINDMVIEEAKNADIIIFAVNGKTNWKRLLEGEVQELQMMKEKLQENGILIWKKLLVVITHADTAMVKAERFGGRKFRKMGGLKIHKERNGEVYKVILDSLRKDTLFGEDFPGHKLFILSTLNDVNTRYDYYSSLRNRFLDRVSLLHKELVFKLPAEAFLYSVWKQISNSYDIFHYIRQFRDDMKQDDIQQQIMKLREEYLIELKVLLGKVFSEGVLGMKEKVCESELEVKGTFRRDKEAHGHLVRRFKNVLENSVRSLFLVTMSNIQDAALRLVEKKYGGYFEGFILPNYEVKQGFLDGVWEIVKFIPGLIVDICRVVIDKVFGGKEFDIEWRRNCFDSLFSKVKEKEDEIVTKCVNEFKNKINTRLIYEFEANEKKIKDALIQYENFGDSKIVDKMEELLIHEMELLKIRNKYFFNEMIKKKSSS